MTIALIAIFIIGYAFIAFEHKLKIDKAASALITGVLCWAVLVLGVAILPEHLQVHFDTLNNVNVHLGKEKIGLAEFFEHRLLHHMEDIAGILLFLLGAMTIVELVDAHEGFRVVTDRIQTTSKVRLMWTVAILTFFLSAVLDNLTTTIVMVSLCRKLIVQKPLRWLFAGIIVISANAGGAWSPLGDVTTTMLWIGRQITTAPIIKEIFLASLMNMVVPLAVMSLVLKGHVKRPDLAGNGEGQLRGLERSIVFFTGIGGLLFVPVFKKLTHLPPFMGMMLSLGVIWLVTELLHKKKVETERSRFSAHHALRKIDTPSILFFLGILLAVSALQEAGHLLSMAQWLTDHLHNIYSINLAIGALSAIVDNVPLVAACMGMYEISPAGTSDPWLSQFVQDGPFWHFLAYTAGTGGSMLIIGSAAGVAAMGLEKIDFIWYLKRISLWALLGYVAGALVYLGERWLGI